jgi:hypothetical protein
MTAYRPSGEYAGYVIGSASEPYRSRKVPRARSNGASWRMQPRHTTADAPPGARSCGESGIPDPAAVAAAHAPGEVDDVELEDPP